MDKVIKWKDINKIEDGCGGEIYKVVDTENSELKKVEIAMCIFAPGVIAKLHYHKKMEEIYFILEGQGEIELDGKWYPVKTENSIPIPIGVKHRIKNTSDNNILKFLAINSPEWHIDDMIEVEK